MVAITVISVSILAIIMLFGLSALTWLASELWLAPIQLILFNVLVFFLAFMVFSFVFSMLGDLYDLEPYFWEWQYDANYRRER